MKIAIKSLICKLDCIVSILWNSIIQQKQHFIDKTTFLTFKTCSNCTKTQTSAVYRNLYFLWSLSACKVYQLLYFIATLPSVFLTNNE